MDYEKPQIQVLTLEEYNEVLLEEGLVGVEAAAQTSNVIVTRA